MLAADVAERRLTSQARPLLLLPGQPPQLEFGVGRRAARTDIQTDRQTEGVKVRPTGPDGPTPRRPYSLQQADLELQAAEHLVQAVRVRQQAAGVQNLGGVDLRVVLLHARQAEHVS